MSLVRFRPEAPTGDKYLLPTYADLAHLVERNLAKVEVAGSSPVIRSILFNTLRLDGECAVLPRVKPEVLPMKASLADAFLQIRRHSQVVRQRSAKPLCPSSNLGGASKSKSTPRGCFLIWKSLVSLKWLRPAKRGGSSSHLHRSAAVACRPTAR